MQFRGPGDGCTGPLSHQPSRFSWKAAQVGRPCPWSFYSPPYNLNSQAARFQACKHWKSRLSLIHPPVHFYEKTIPEEYIHMDVVEISIQRAGRIFRSSFQNVPGNRRCDHRSSPLLPLDRWRRCGFVKKKKSPRGTRDPSDFSASPR